MRLKDYYKILELSPEASPDDIKRSFRRLAKKFHPDLSGEDKISSAHFKEIREAYDNLIHPQRRDHYLQQRWYHQSIARRLREVEPASPSSLLKEIYRLEKYVSTLDPFRIDQEGLFQYFNQLLSNENLEMLEEFGELDLNRRIGHLVLAASKPLSFRETQIICKKLPIFLSRDQEIIRRIHSILRTKKRNEKWEKYKPLLAFAIVIILCFLIYFLSSR